MLRLAWTNCVWDCVIRPGCCIDADGLFIGEATLRKIFCLQETLRGVGGRPPLTESLLQPDRVLFLPSPLLREKMQRHRHTINDSGIILHQNSFGKHTSFSSQMHIHLTSPLRKPYTSFWSTNSLSWWEMVKMNLKHDFKETCTRHWLIPNVYVIRAKGSVM